MNETEERKKQRIKEGATKGAKEKLVLSKRKSKKKKMREIREEFSD